jgi:hypothetical protein
LLRIAMLVPGSVLFTPDEQRRMIRVRIAERLHVLPAAVDTMSYYDVCDCLAMWSAELKGPTPSGGAFPELNDDEEANE